MASNQPDSVDSIWDVIVVGAGPAGSATAITLASLGQRVLLADEKQTTTYKLGESLAPSSVELVKHFLGNFEESGPKSFGFYRSAGNLSSWFSEQLDHSDFFFSSSGFGLCIDRLAFDQALVLRAVAAGATLIRGLTIQSCTRSVEPGWNWEIDSNASDGKQRYRARYLVDCSGRRAAVAKLIGVPIVEDNDRLFAYARWYSTKKMDEDCFTRIEATRHGWWYTNRLPSDDPNESKRLVIFHSDRDLPEGKQAATQVGFDQLLSESMQIAPILEENRYQASGVIRGAAANSQRLRDFCGDAWMAIGDAAQAYDPLSSQGIEKALRTASHAGHLIHYALSDTSKDAVIPDASHHHIQQYDLQQQTLWKAYLYNRNYYYSIQTRWPDQLFWARRQHHTDT